MEKTTDEKIRHLDKRIEKNFEENLRKKARQIYRQTRLKLDLKNLRMKEKKKEWAFKGFSEHHRIYEQPQNEDEKQELLTAETPFTIDLINSKDQVVLYQCKYHIGDDGKLEIEPIILEEIAEHLTTDGQKIWISEFSRKVDDGDGDWHWESEFGNLGSRDTWNEA